MEDYELDRKIQNAKREVPDIKVNNISTTFLTKNNQFSNRLLEQQRNKLALGNFNSKLRSD